MIKILSILAILAVLETEGLAGDTIAEMAKEGGGETFLKKN
jgi:hypothetical protein